MIKFRSYERLEVFMVTTKVITTKVEDPEIEDGYVQISTEVQLAEPKLAVNAVILLEPLGENIEVGNMIRDNLGVIYKVTFRNAGLVTAETIDSSQRIGVKFVIPEAFTVIHKPFQEGSK